MPILQVDQLSNSAGTGPTAFPFGLINNGSISANDTNVAFTVSSNRMQLGCTPTTARTYTLPSAGISAGDIWVFYNKSTSWSNYITLQTTGLNTIAIVPPLGFVVVAANQNTPAGASSWSILYRQSQFVAFTPTYTGFGTVTNAAMSLRMIGDEAEGYFSCTTGTVAASLFSVSLPAAIVINASKLTINNTTGQDGNAIGTFAGGGSTTEGDCWLLAAPATSTSLLYAGNFFSSVGTGALIAQNGNTISGSSSAQSSMFKIPINN